MQPEFPSQLYVVAIVAGQRIAVQADRVAAIVDLSDIVAVPLAPDHVMGLCALRSQILTVIDLARALGQPPEMSSRRAITMELDNHSYAFVVNTVERVEPSITAVRAIDASIGADWAIAAVGSVQTDGGFAMVIDPARVTEIRAELVQ